MWCSSADPVLNLRRTLLSTFVAEGFARGQLDLVVAQAVLGPGLVDDLVDLLPLAELAEVAVRHCVAVLLYPVLRPYEAAGFSASQRYLGDCCRCSRDVCTPSDSRCPAFCKRAGRRSELAACKILASEQGTRQQPVSGALLRLEAAGDA